jgi:hypothetical protein
VQISTLAIRKTSVSVRGFSVEMLASWEILVSFVGINSIADKKKEGKGYPEEDCYDKSGIYFKIGSVLLLAEQRSLYFFF